jgi:hypothetical protein
MSSWPDFAAFTTPETAYKALLRQAFFRKMKDDFDNLNGRVGQLETGILVTDHFNGPAGRFIEAGGVGSLSTRVRFDGRGIWALLQSGGAGTPDVALPSSPAFSVLRLDADDASTNSRYSILLSLQDFVFNDSTRPVTYRARTKWRGQRANKEAHNVWGLVTDLTPGSSPNSGIWLEMPDTSNFRFVTRDNGSQVNGSNFARTSADTWFEPYIEFTDSPSNRAKCYIDGVLKETFTTSLPTSRRLMGVIAAIQSHVGGGGAGTTAFQVDADRCRLAVDALVDAA